MLTANESFTNLIIENNNNKRINFKAIDEETCLAIKQSYLDNFAKKTKIKSKKNLTK